VLLGSRATAANRGLAAGTNLPISEMTTLDPSSLGRFRVLIRAERRIALLACELEPSERKINIGRLYGQVAS
jgi:hypothetical protein